MKIYSPFKDYYDTALAYGIDTTIKYVRYQNIITKPKPHLLSNYGTVFSLQSQTHVLDFNQIYVGFCGSVYMGIAPIINIQKKLHSITPGYIYRLDTLVQWLRNHMPKILKPKLEKWINDTRGQTKWFRWDTDAHFFGGTTSLTALKYSWNHITKHNSEWFAEYNVPVFTVVKDSDYRVADKLILNAQLKNVNFERQIDPYNAFQQISQYVSGVLANRESPDINISDEDMRDMKGFDKWSFKNRVHQSKPRKKNK